MTPDKISIDAARHLHSLPWISPELKSTLENDFPELKESEDESIRKILIHIVKGACDKYGVKYKEDIITKEKLLDYLERQPQSQAVYKTAIENILEMCNSCDIKRQFGAKAMDFWAGVKVKCEEALQACPSLNESHWKPSEEQIGALNYAYCELFKRQDVEHNILGPLQKLIDNLQKLLQS